MANPFIPSIGIGSTIVGFIVLFIIYLLIVGFVLWLAGEVVVGRKVTFGEALAVAGTGTFLVGAVISFVQGLFGLLIGLLIFLFLVKHYFKTGWFGAIGVAVMAIVVIVVLTFVLGAVLIGALFGFPRIF
ncbi:MAG: hypothetical protein AUI50_01270 [Crenarchaeota archaeon 13_1_40CM_2_52_14]|nr:MAG: hypothetical protein AUI97_00025 [Crenarchaeota archaeon 13_1_40CM_3_52_17]OLD35613.1 MAG: hypothetical protein AUI50_01270 [Crenarchaeota archaeon 13_1_40CM_2_52_14]